VSTKSATSGIAVIGWTYSCGCVCSRLYQIRQTMCSFVKDGDNIVFAQGNKATLMKGNRNIEQRGPLGKTLPRKTTTTLPVVAQQWCPFRINIYYHKSDGYYYLSTNGNVQYFQKGLICSHQHHERQMVVFSIRNDMDEHVEKMVKQFAMKNSSPSTCVRMLHRMDDRLNDVQTIADIFNKAKKSLLEEKGVDMSSKKAQQLVDYLILSHICSITWMSRFKNLPTYPSVLMSCASLYQSNKIGSTDPLHSEKNLASCGITTG
jgi:hypothetical protein